MLTETLSGKDTNDIDIEMRRLPYPTYADDKFLVALQGWLPLIIMLSFIYPALNIVKSVVHEKERRLKESMKMMGLPNWLHWTAWFVKSLAFILVTILLITCLLKARWGLGTTSLAALEKSDGTLFFFFLFVFTVTSISFCFLMTVFFSSGEWLPRQPTAATDADVVLFCFRSRGSSQLCGHGSRHHLVLHVLSVLFPAAALRQSDQGRQARLVPLLQHGHGLRRPAHRHVRGHQRGHPGTYSTRCRSMTQLQR